LTVSACVIISPTRAMPLWPPFFSFRLLAQAENFDYRILRSTRLPASRTFSLNSSYYAMTGSTRNTTWTDFSPLVAMLGASGPCYPMLFTIHGSTATSLLHGYRERQLLLIP
jgi:hypothetical protein